MKLSTHQRITSGIFAFSLSLTAAAAPTLIRDILISPATEGAQLSLVVDRVVSPKIFRLSNPERLVIDFKETQLARKLPSFDLAATPVKAIRAGIRDGYDLRLVLDLKEPISINSSVEPSGSGSRMTISIHSKSGKVAVQASRAERPGREAPAPIVSLLPTPITTPSATKTAPKTTPKQRAVAVLSPVPQRRASAPSPQITSPVKPPGIVAIDSASPRPLLPRAVGATPIPARPAVRALKKSEPPIVAPPPAPPPVAEAVRDVVIAIDAGHGGDDPGAKGYNGTLEKDIVLSIARKLATLIAAEPGMKPILLRDGDHFLTLRQRLEKSRRHRADFLVSIHADAFNDPRAKGASVYTLSSRGATSEAARWLADRENAADLVGGLSLDNKDQMVASVLLDLAQTATNEASNRAASKVLHQLRGLGNLHGNRVQQASFVVLKSPDIPSILVETAFISNPDEEVKLRSAAYQTQMAQAIFAGINNYFTHFPPTGTLLAATRRHIISQGDTLGKIAEQYRVSVQSIKLANNLRGNTLAPGRVLNIPFATEG